MANPRKPTALKIIAGTDQPCRRVAEPDIELPLVASIPDPPDWLPNAHAVKEWRRLAALLHANKLLTEACLSALGILCSMHGKIVQLYAAGESPTGHMVAQLRALSNDFGLTPASLGKVTPSRGSSRSNRFLNNGKR